MNKKAVAAITLPGILLLAAVIRPSQRQDAWRLPASAEDCFRLFSQADPNPALQVYVTGDRRNQLEIVDPRTGERDASWLGNRLPPSQLYPIESATITADGKSVILTQVTDRAELTVTFWQLGDSSSSARQLNSYSIDFGKDMERPKISVDASNGKVTIARLRWKAAKPDELAQWNLRALAEREPITNQTRKMTDEEIAAEHAAGRDPGNYPMVTTPGFVREETKVIDASTPSEVRIKGGH